MQYLLLIAFYDDNKLSDKYLQIVLFNRSRLTYNPASKILQVSHQMKINHLNLFLKNLFKS